jgi:hypothetical protein
MSTEEERKILGDLKEKGYSLEVDVVDWLIENGWNVFPQHVYFDERSKKVRTIDVVAYYFDKRLKIWELPILMVECKTSKNPWVFYSTPYFLQQVQAPEKGFNVLSLSAIGSTLLHLLHPYVNWTEFPESVPFPEQTLKLIYEIHYFNKDLPRAHSCHVAFRKKKDSPDDFQKAIYQIRGAYLQLSKEIPKTPIFPVIVLKGKMFEYKKENQLEQLQPRNHILYSSFWLFPKEFDPTKRSFPPSVIDIVESTYFLKFLEILRRDFKIPADI